MIALKAGFAMVGYTHIPVEAPGWRKTFINLKMG
jgi:hypothetical protein